MQAPYTGCNPRGLLLSRDKVLCKQLLAFHRIPTPQFAVFRRRQRFAVPRRLRPPLFVKSATEDASLGIAQASVVEDMQHLRERVQFMHEQIGSDALVEEYIEGRELYVGVLGNERLTRPADLGDALRFDDRTRCRHRHPQGQVGPGLSADATALPPGGRGARPPRCCRRARSPVAAASIGRCICRAMRASIFACAPTAACSCSKPMPIPISSARRISLRPQRPPV